MKHTTRKALISRWFGAAVCGFALLGSRSEAEDPPRPVASPYAKLATLTFEQYAKAAGYSEGPTWRDGELFFCSNGLQRVTKDRKVQKYLDIGPAGTYLCGNGHILICDNKGPALLDLAPDGAVGVVVDSYRGKKLESLNDLTVDAAGNVYWTDPANSSRENPVGKIFRVRPDGRVDLLASDLAFPNGLDVDPGSQFLYVIESQTAKVLRYALPADDRPLGKPTVFAALGGSGGDGCVFDAAGNFWVADFHRPDTKKGRITVFSPDGAVLGTAPVPAGVVSNLTFGGPGHDEIFCTTGTPDGVFHAVVGIRGFKGHPGKPLKIIRSLDIKPVDGSGK